MKKKLYVETSVWNQLYKSNRPDWNSITEKFMNMVRKSEVYEIYISSYVLIEIEECYEEKRKVLLEWIQKISPILLDDSLECETMMAKYFEAGILEP